MVCRSAYKQVTAFRKVGKDRKYEGDEDAYREAQPGYILLAMLTATHY
jgi:hypothetical protein